MARVNRVAGKVKAIASPTTASEARAALQSIKATIVPTVTEDGKADSSPAGSLAKFNALCNSGRSWFRTYILANTASTKKRIQIVGPRQQFEIGAHHQGESLAMVKLVAAQAIKPLEDRMEAQLGMLLDLVEDGDGARLADLFRQVICA